MAYKCKYAYRQPGVTSLLCLKLQDAPSLMGQKPFCGSQYHCGVTGKWENTAGAANCPVPKMDAALFQQTVPQTAEKPTEQAQKPPEAKQDTSIPAVAENAIKAFGAGKKKKKK